MLTMSITRWQHIGKLRDLQQRLEVAPAVSGLVSGDYTIMVMSDE